MPSMTDNPYLLIPAVMLVTFSVLSLLLFLLYRNQNQVLKVKAQMNLAQLAHQGELLKAIIQSQDEERSRIGRDLHDDIGTGLATAIFKLQALNPLTITSDKFQSFQDDFVQQIQGVAEQVRHISHHLAPPALTLFGFGDAFRELCESMNRSGRIAVELDMLEIEPFRLNAAASLALYRILEELIQNTIKHAQATVIQIVFQQAAAVLRIQYADNGRGQSATAQVAKGLGMQNIRIRLDTIGGSYELMARNGYQMNIQIPLMHSTIDHG